MIPQNVSECQFFFAKKTVKNTTMHVAFGREDAYPACGVNILAANFRIIVLGSSLL